MILDIRCSELIMFVCKNRKALKSLLIYKEKCLYFTDAQAKISGPSEVYVKKGSTISLTCSVNVHSTPPSSVSWYHGHSVVDFDSPRGGISLETERTEAGTTSKLLVTKALISDSGNYTCMPSNASPASTIVHVLNGELNGVYRYSMREVNTFINSCHCYWKYAKCIPCAFGFVWSVVKRIKQWITLS